MAALFKRHTEDIAGFCEGRLIRGVNLNNRIFALLFAFEDLERGRFIRRRDHAIRNFAGDEFRSGYIYCIGQSDEIAERAQTVRAASARVRRGKRREFEIVHEITFLERVRKRNGYCRTRGTDVLERSRGGQTERGL